MRDAIGDDAANRYERGPWGFSSLDDLRAVVEEAGFSSVHAAARTVDAEFAGGPTGFARSLAASPVGPDVAALTALGRARLAEAAERYLGPLTVDGVLRGPTVSNIVVAHR